MASRSSVVLAFALAFAVFIIMPALLGKPFPPYPLMHWGDIFDLFTPLVIVPLYWLLFLDTTRATRGTTATIAFLLLASLWVEGHGMHLSANSISNLLGPGSSAVHNLVHFYDEVLSHYLWHFAIIGFSIFLLSHVNSSPTGASVHWTLVAPSAILYGFSFFLAIDEGGTVPLGLPAAALIVLWIAFSRRRLVGKHNLVGFFLVGYAVAIALFLGWYLYWGGFPEFSEIGII